MQAALDFLGPRALGRAAKGQILGLLGPLRPPDSPLPTARPSPHLPSLPSILPSHSCHLWASVPTSHHMAPQPPLTPHVLSESSWFKFPHIPSQDPLSTSTHGTCLFRKFLVQIPPTAHLSLLPGICLSHGLLANLWSGHVEARLWP